MGYMTNGSGDRLDQMEQLLERSMQLLEGLAENQRQLIQNQDQQQSQIQVLADAALNHESRIARQDALIERLDAIIERLIYREGRSNGDQPQQ